MKKLFTLLLILGLCTSFIQAQFTEVLEDPVNELVEPVDDIDDVVAPRVNEVGPINNNVVATNGIVAPVAPIVTPAVEPAPGIPVPATTVTTTRKVTPRGITTRETTEPRRVVPRATTEALSCTQAAQRLQGLRNQVQDLRTQIAEVKDQMRAGGCAIPVRTTGVRRSVVFEPAEPVLSTPVFNLVPSHDDLMSGVY